MKWSDTSLPKTVTSQPTRFGMSFWSLLWKLTTPSKTFQDCQRVSCRHASRSTSTWWWTWWRSSSSNWGNSTRPTTFSATSQPWLRGRRCSHWCLSRSGQWWSSTSSRRSERSIRWMEWPTNTRTNSWTSKLSLRTTASCCWRQLAKQRNCGKKWIKDSPIKRSYSKI